MSLRVYIWKTMKSIEPRPQVKEAPSNPSFHRIARKATQAGEFRRQAI
jgi:hypothetical protein